MLDPNVVKVVADRSQRALYFSRAPIPWHRDGPAGAGARRHIGIYAYRVAALRQLTALPPSTLELIEKLEQLRALENGMDIRVADSSVPPGPDVNTPEDALRIAALLAAGP
jgi:3-deoxy-manno-octulosonate cytidylyltransferase (CMP-KDO synthetase)